MRASRNTAQHRARPRSHIRQQRRASQALPQHLFIVKGRLGSGKSRRCSSRVLSSVQNGCPSCWRRLGYGRNWCRLGRGIGFGKLRIWRRHGVGQNVRSASGWCKFRCHEFLFRRLLHEYPGCTGSLTGSAESSASAEKLNLVFHIDTFPPQIVLLLGSRLEENSNGCWCCGDVLCALPEPRMR